MNRKKRIPPIAIVLFLLFVNLPFVSANNRAKPFAPGEKLTYQLRWQNIPAGEAQLEVFPVRTFNGARAYHFVMTAKSNEFVDYFYKVRDRIEAYADTGMTQSLYYRKKQEEGHREKDITVQFDWTKKTASYSNYGRKRAPLSLMAGSFDPLSALYYTRMADLDSRRPLERPVTDGKKNVMGRAKVVGKERITLQSGATYDTIIIEPEMKHIGGVFRKSKGAKIRVWLTADKRRIPVQVKSKVIVGHFIGELVSAEGVQ